MRRPLCLAPVLLVLALLPGCGDSTAAGTKVAAAGPSAAPASASDSADPVEALAQRAKDARPVPAQETDPSLGATPAKAARYARVSPGAPSDKQVNNELEDLAALAKEQASVQAAILDSSYNFAGGSGKLLWPVRGPITSPFCERRAWEACHPGIDIGVGSGTPIHAAAAGVVVLAGPQGGYGNFTCVRHTRALATCYAHQSKFLVEAGDVVKRGQVIGLTGCTGLCFGAHLHFEVRIDGQVVNPLLYL